LLDRLLEAGLRLLEGWLLGGRLRGCRLVNGLRRSRLVDRLTVDRTRVGGVVTSVATAAATTGLQVGNACQRGSNGDSSDQHGSGEQGHGFVPFERGLFCCLPS